MAVVVRLIEFVESIVVEWVQMKMVELRRSEMGCDVVIVVVVDLEVKVVVEVEVEVVDLVAVVVDVVEAELLELDMELVEH
ncbi:hypothetical protein ACET3Z_005241 [Daucus carota]